MTLKSLAVGLAALLFIGGCTSAPEPSASLLYTATRSWSNGIEESVEVYADGRTIMTHGDYEERFTLPTDQMAELAAATTPALPGSNSDDPILGVTVSGSTEVRPAALTPGSIAELLNKLLDSHTLDD
jgi:hypothetical protein